VVSGSFRDALRLLLSAPSASERGGNDTADAARRLLHLRRPGRPLLERLLHLQALLQAPGQDAGAGASLGFGYIRGLASASVVDGGGGASEFF